MAGPVTRKASPTQVYELLQKLDGYTDNVSGNLYSIKRTVNELLGMKLNVAQKEQLDKVEYRVYRSLSQADVARYFADSRPIDLSKAYNKDGTFKDVGEALSAFEKLAKDPRNNVYTLRRLLNELGLEKNRMDAKRRAQYERCHELVETGVKTQAERHFVFESYRPTLPRAAPKESVPVKVEAGKLKTMDETLKALGIILKNPGLYLHELKKIHKEWDLKAQANAKRTEYDRLMLEIDRKLSIRDQLEIYPVERTQAAKPAAKPDLLKMRQQPEPERAMLGEDTSYAGRPRPSLMGRDLFMPVKMTEVPKAPGAPKDWYNYMGATTEAEAKQRADGFAQALYNSVYARLMGDSGWKAREGATLQDYLKGNAEKGIAPIPASYLRVLFRGANKETTDKIISELSAGDALGAYATALRNGVGDSPFANFMWNDLKNTLEKMRVLVPMVAFVNEAEMTVLETKRVAMSVYAFVDLVTSGVFAPRLNKNDVDKTLTLSLDYTGAAQRVVPGAGLSFGLKPRKRPREGEMFYVEARVEGRPGGEDVFQGAVGTFVLGYKDESGRTRVRGGKTPLYYAVSTEATTEGEVRVKGAFGFGIGRDDKGKPVAIIIGLRGVARESTISPPLTRLSGDVKVNMAFPPMKGAGFGRRLLHPDQVTISLGGGGLGQTSFAYPAWLLGPGIKAEWNLGKRMRLDLGADAKFGKLNIPDDVAFNSPMGKFYMLYMLSAKLEF